MKIYEFRNSKGELELSVNAYAKTSIKEIEKYFGKNIELINKELKNFNCITKDGETYTMSTMFLDFMEEE